MKVLPVPPVTAAQSGPELRDIHLPPAPFWWPPAPGWWMLASLVLLVFFAGAWLWRRRRRAAAQRQRVLREVDRLAEQHRLDGDGAALAAGLHQLLRRVARQRDPDTARQTGVAWQQTLARVPLETSALERLFVLDELMYRSRPLFDHATLVSDVRSWLQLALKPSAWKARTREQPDA